MAHHEHHDHHQHHNQHAHHDKPKSNGLHKDWRTWVVVLLMLAAMGMYIWSDDEAVGPNGEPMPAAADAE